jgi:hypothetical protein
MVLTGLAFATAAKILADFAVARNAPKDYGSGRETSALATATDTYGDADFFQKPVELFARFDSQLGQPLGGVLSILERSNAALVEALAFAERAVPNLKTYDMNAVTDEMVNELETGMYSTRPGLGGGRPVERTGRLPVRPTGRGSVDLPSDLRTGGRPVERAAAARRQPRRPNVWQSKAPMILGIIAVCRGGFLLLCDVEQAPGTERLGAGVSRRLFAADIIFSSACVTALYAGGAMEPSDVAGAVACTAAGWVGSAAALFANRDPLGPDPPRGEFLARRALAAAGIVATWGAWVQARHSG